MGIRNKVNNKGWISEKIAGTAVEVDLSAGTETVAPLKGSTFATSAATTAIVAPVGMLAAGAAGTTASLPAIGEANVGKTFMVFSSGSASTFVTSSNTINGGAWTRSLFNPFSIVTFVAYSSSLNGYGWVASSGSAI